MKKIILLLLLSISFVLANVGKITAVKGDVTVLRGAEKIVAKGGFILEKNDKVLTQDKSKALVLFNDNTSITVGKSSTLSVNEFVIDEKIPSNSKTNFGFGKGVFRTITGKIGKINPKGFKIKTKSASIGIRGTDLTAKVAEDGSTDVSFAQGQGTITPIGGQELPVATGQTGSVSPDGTAEVKEGLIPESQQMEEESNELEEEAATQQEETTEEEQAAEEEQTEEEQAAEEEQTEEEATTDEEQTTEEEAATEEEQTTEEEATAEETTTEEEQTDEEQVATEEEATTEEEQTTEEQTTQDEQAAEEETTTEETTTQDEQQEEQVATEETQQEEEQTTTETTENTGNDEEQQTTEQNQQQEEQQTTEQTQQQEEQQSTEQNQQTTEQNQQQNDTETQQPDNTDNTVQTEQTTTEQQTQEPVASNAVTTDTTTTDTSLPDTDTPLLDTDIDTDIPDVDTDTISDTASKANEAAQQAIQAAQQAEDAAQQAQQTSKQVPKNTAPSFSDVSISVKEDEIATILVRASDIDGDTLSYSISNQPNNGTAIIDSATGTMNYTPNTNYFGSESITVLVSDGTDTVEKIHNFDVESVNDLPSVTLSLSLIELDEDTSKTLTYTTSDVEDGTSSGVSATVEHGEVSIENGELVYTPTNDYYGEDTITVVVTDSDGGQTTSTISVTVNNVEVDVVVKSPHGEVSSSLEDITNKIMCTSDGLCGDKYDSFSTYLDFGFLKESINSETYSDVFLFGKTTPSAVIEQYIQNLHTATYNGGVASFVDGTAYSGSVNLDINFGTKNLTGGINIDNGWKANINSGTVNSYGFKSSDISSAAGSSASNISGNMNGKFYGPNAEAVGGEFKLNSGSSSADGVFGASKSTAIGY